MDRTVHSYGEILIQREAPELTTCTCGRAPNLSYGSHGFIGVWRVFCTCGARAPAALKPKGAIRNWESARDDGGVSPRPMTQPLVHTEIE
jgi:hypothetical protein